MRKIEQELAANASLEAINLQTWTDGPHQSQAYNGTLSWAARSLSTNEHPKTGYPPIQSMIVIFFIVSWPWNAAKVPLLLAKLTQTKYVQISKLEFSCQPYSCWTPYSKFNNPLYIPYYIATTSQFYIPIISAFKKKICWSRWSPNVHRPSCSSEALPFFCHRNCRVRRTGWWDGSCQSDHLKVTRCTWGIQWEIIIGF